MFVFLFIAIFLKCRMNFHPHTLFLSGWLMQFTVLHIVSCYISLLVALTVLYATFIRCCGGQFAFLYTMLICLLKYIIIGVC